MKKLFLIFSIFVLVFVTGCSKELSYKGDELIYYCTEEDLNLFNDELKINISDNQGFVMIDNNNEMSEYTDGLLEYNKEENGDVSKCFFISYEEITDNKFASRTAISHRDPIEGGMKISVSGTYSFKVNNSKLFYETYTTLEQLNNYINTNINSVYILNMPSKTYDELSSEKEFDTAKLASVNSLVAKYGVEVTKVNIEKVEKSN